GTAPKAELGQDPARQHAGAGGGGFRNLAPDGGPVRSVKDPSTSSTPTGIWVGLAAIAMSFAALTSALYVREGSGYADWTHISLPPVLWFNTAALVLSSI